MGIAIATLKKRIIRITKKVHKEIFDTVESLKYNTKIYPLDKHRRNNNSRVRTFEVYGYRISYEVTKSEIRTYELDIQKESL